MRFGKQLELGTYEPWRDYVSAFTCCNAQESIAYMKPNVYRNNTMIKIFFAHIHETYNDHIHSICTMGGSNGSFAGDDSSLTNWKRPWLAALPSR